MKLTISHFYFGDIKNEIYLRGGTTFGSKVKSEKTPIAHLALFLCEIHHNEWVLTFENGKVVRFSPDSDISLKITNDSVDG